MPYCLENNAKQSQYIFNTGEKQSFANIFDHWFVESIDIKSIDMESWLYCSSIFKQLIDFMKTFGFPFYSMVYNVPTIIYINTQIAPNLVSEKPFNLAPMTFWHVSIIFWALFFHSAQTQCKLFLYLYILYCPGHQISHISIEIIFF